MPVAQMLMPVAPIPSCGKGQAVHGWVSSKDRHFSGVLGRNWTGFGSDLARSVCPFPFWRRQTMDSILAVTPSLSGHQPDCPFSASSAFQVHSILLIQEVSQHFGSSLKYISSHWFRGSKEPSHRMPEPWGHITKARWL